jgi:predicted dehydrogenase
VAFIGVGGRGSDIANQASDIGKGVACCDVDKAKADKFASFRKEKGDDLKIYTDYREMLEKEKDVDAVTIGTPDHWHVKIAVEALEAGKHVYCEKPLTLTIEEGKIIKAAVAKSGKTFQVGTQQRSEFGERFLKAVALAHLGRLGSNLRAVSSVGKAASRSENKNAPFGPFTPVAPPETLNWDMWQGPAQATEFVNERVGWNFRWWFEYSGGQVTDWGVHHTDIAFWALAGKDGQALSAEGNGKFMGVDREQVLKFLTNKEPITSLPQAWNVAFEFDVDINLSTGNKIKLISGDNALTLEGDLGKIRVNRERLTGKPVEDLEKDEKGRKEVEEKMAELYGGELPKEHLGHMQNFFDCIASGKAPVANVNDHVRAVNACHLANIALVTNRKVEFNPDTNSFDNDVEANAMVARKRRPEWDIHVG